MKRESYNQTIYSQFYYSMSARSSYSTKARKANAPGKP
jgi:hypothetical protein